MENKTSYLLKKLNGIITKDLEWGVKSDFNLGWTRPEDRDIWCGEFGNDMALEIMGDENSPNPFLMESAMKIIDNLDHYLSILPYNLGDDEDQWQPLALTLLNQENPDEFEIELISYYGAGIGILFRDGEIVKEENYFDRVKGLIEGNLNGENCGDFDKIIFFSDFDTYNHKALQILLYNYLNRFCGKDLSAIINEIWRGDIISEPGKDLNKLKIKTVSVIKDQKVRCRDCGIESKTDLLFNHGYCVNYPEYKIKDEVKWGDINHGEVMDNTIYISAVSPERCKCGKELSTLIECKDNKLSKVCDDKALKVKYGPWLGEKYITDELIFLDEYKRIKSREHLLKICETSRYKRNRIIDRSMEQSIKYSMGSHPEKTEAYSYFINRELFSEKERENMDKFFGFNFHGHSVKSVCILKNTDFFCGSCKSKITSDFWFYWGSLLDFPEYEKGDLIRWSDYSMGFESEKTVYAVGNPIFGHGHCRGFQVLIEIKDNIISGVKFLDSYHQKVKAYTGEGKKSFLLWPDDKFL